MKKTLLSIFALSNLVCLAQDVHFSQVYNNPLHVNPANVGGFVGYERIILNYRSQWTSAGSPFNTMGFSFDMPMFQKDGSKTHLGLGISVFNDRAGSTKMGTTAPALTLGAIVPVSSHSTLTTAIQAGYTMRSLNLSSATWASQFDGTDYDPALPSLESAGSSSAGAFDLGAGIRYSYDRKKESFQGFAFSKFDIGGGVYHLTQPKFNFLAGNDKLNYKISIQSSARFEIKDSKVSLMPYFVGFLQGAYKEYNGGVMARFKLSEGTKITGLLTESALSFGLHYRADDALVPQVMFEYGSWGIAVSYDVTTSNFNEINNLAGGFEVSLRWHDLKGAIFKKRVNATVY